MKVYFHLNLEGFSNCYLVVNEKTNEAVIIDPGKVTEGLIAQIESKPYHLVGILITHNHGSHVHGLKTLQKIYSPKVLAADSEVAGSDTKVITGDGKVRLGGLLVHYMSIPGHTSDSVLYKIGNVLFTGDVISAGEIGDTASSYSQFVLKTNIKEKIFSQNEDIILMPGHGPPTTIGAAKKFNVDL